MTDNAGFAINTPRPVASPVTGQMSVKRQHDQADQQSKRRNQKRKKKHLTDEIIVSAVKPITDDQKVIDTLDIEEPPHKFDLLA